MDLPVVDLAPYLEIVECSDPTAEEEAHLRSMCAAVSASLRDTGALIVKDPRCTAQDNDRFLDMMESYFERSDEFKRLQERPQLHYQVGATPEGIEVPRSLVDEEMQEKIKKIPKEYQPATPSGPDPKWRYMWRVGPRPLNTCFKELNAEPVIPDGFPEWKETMDFWGSKMISAIEVVAEMAAIGFGLSKDAFTSLMNQGPHLLAPTGSDLKKHGSEGTVFAGFHYDLNFLTIHGRSRFPGLNIWVRSGQKMEVKVPLGCLLIQTGKQLEWLTGGECLAGMHEVVVTNRTLEAIERARQENRSLWRVSSTLFGHIASDALLKPLGQFEEGPLASNYPPMYAGEYVEQELSAINLKGVALM
ncbi:2-oxoglutarate (2OG) and Fe(II)-dependent oxygenase superfamily protein [Rhynchospora pubera]|uniref:2-oxoglutarate (2OG) and Fe(II)-dependent oxygenase superfamily protein n=1 Tax=Rhynchospora pubera TaxID=906938 RepID=A0AAV8DAK8_9POAL|nr:2-oxoglutarate (2OG) and Fe(II)-dependent oxygenase superfamily protein [Rhynchospora pubera]